MKAPQALGFALLALLLLGGCATERVVYVSNFCLLADFWRPSEAAFNAFDEEDHRQMYSHNQLILDRCPDRAKELNLGE